MNLGALLLVLASTSAALAETSETGFLDRSVVVDSVEYRYQVYVPRDYPHIAPLPAILFLHGAGERGSDGILQTTEGLPAEIRRDAARFPAIVILPQSPVDAPGWQDLGGRVAIAALDSAEQEFSLDPKRTCLTGLSQGGNGSWYLAYQYPERFAAVLVVCGFVEKLTGVVSGTEYPSIAPADSPDPFAAVARRIARLPIWIFHGGADPAVPVEQARGMAAALRVLGADVQYSELVGVGHNAWDVAYGRGDVIDWLFAQRQP